MLGFSGLTKIITARRGLTIMAFVAFWVIFTVLLVQTKWPGMVTEGITYLRSASNLKTSKDVKDLIMKNGRVSYQHKTWASNPRVLDDPYHTAFVPYLRGIYKTNLDCQPPEKDGPTHNFTNPPYFSCSKPFPNSRASNLSDGTREQIRIWCDDADGNAYSELQQVPKRSPLQSFNTDAEVRCLQRYIQQNCYDSYRIPNIVHLIWFGNAQLDMRTAVPFYSISTILKPCLILIHGAPLKYNFYWDLFLPHTTNAVSLKKEQRTKMFGIRIANVGNRADIARLEVLRDFGGIYLDTDSLILKPIDIFRATSFAAGLEGNFPTMSNALMLAEANHSLLTHWLDHYKTYDGRNWVSHSTVYLTTLTNTFPRLTQAMGPVFIKFGFGGLNNLYDKTCSVGDSFGAHIYRAKFPDKADLESLKFANSTYGRIMRYVLFNDARKCLR
ncbi:uncharacterized protein LOC101860810 [Aplysia californica]|uniref:Uncharacterized protein LOC101860810 n=1 Tax=Aplysia californica TaxID=6500 RepID=A0ABM0ZZP1_APLCA|nr:uncharacterized protein LOC101860810 [Aplysia californica]